MSTTLVLAGHGSHISPNTAGIVWTLVDQLRALGVADEVAAAFWKETPSFHSVFDTLAATDVTIVPLFTARGYFTQTVIPAEMGLEGPLTVRDGRTLRYARTLGEHPHLTHIVRQRIEQTLAQYEIAPEQAAVAIIGHGTRRNPESRSATEAQAALIRRSGLVAEVVAVYLDDAPEIPESYRLTTSPHLIAVPYFLASGSHTTLDLPAELGLASGQHTGHVRGRSVYYTPPVGEDDSLGELALELACEAGAPLHAARDGSAWDGFPARGREELIEAVQAAGSLPFGQLLLTPSRVQVRDDTEDTTALESPSELRSWLRREPFCPLPTACDLPGGWHVGIDEPAQLHAVVETIYPGAVADWAAHRLGEFRAASLGEVAARQTGMLRDLATLSRPQGSALVDGICGGCVRHPTWFHDGSPDGVIPCAEACNTWMSRAWEQNR
jgi:sirohydrochlorin cobaltochelatase